MAAQESFDAQPSASEDSVFHDCFYHVRGAGGRVSARGGQERRDACAIGVHGQECNLADDIYDLVLLHGFVGWLIAALFSLGSGQFGDGFAHGCGDLLLGAELFVHVVEGKEERAVMRFAIVAERLCVESVGFAHESPEQVAVNSMFEE